MQILEWVKRQTGKLADNVKDYKFYVKNQPNFIDSSTTIILTPFTNRDQISTVACVYRWSRIKNGLLSEVPQFKGNSFICEPSDIGSIIQAEVTSTDVSHPGTAILKYGPVKLDVLIKKQVEHALTSGSVTMNIDLVQKDQSRQCQVRITEENIKITHFNSSNQTTFDYTLGEPRIQASLKQPNKVQIFFNQKYQQQIVRFTNTLFGFQDLSGSTKQNMQRRIQLKFPNRSLKDNFLLIIKAFNTKKAMKTSAIINKLENVDLSGNENFNYIIEIESLRADLIKLARLNDKYQGDKRIYYEEARKLQKQIQEIIITYTKIVEGKCKNQNQLDQSVSYMREKKDQIMDRKMDHLARENQTLKDRIDFMNSQLASKGVAHLIGQMPLKAEQNSVSQRGGFIKKRTVPEVAVNPFDNILNDMQKSEDQPAQQQKRILAKQLNQSIRKIAKLQDKIKQLKTNQSAMYFDNLNISGISGTSDKNSPTKKLNLTTIEGEGKAMNQSQRKNKEEFLAMIDELRRKNKKLEQENMFLKQASRIQGSQAGNRSQILNAEQLRTDNKSQSGNKLQSGNKSQLLDVPGIHVLESQQAKLHRRVEELTEQNERLKQQVQRLRIEKQIIQKEKAELQAKYKKKLTELSSENSMMKLNQDRLNRSQNVSMELDDLNREERDMFKKQIDILNAENSKLANLNKKAMDDLKQLNKLRQQNLRLTQNIKQLTNQNASLNISHSQNG